MTRTLPWLRTTFALLVCALLLVACGGGDTETDESEETPIFNGADPTLACPAGQVGWNFATGGASLAGLQGSALSGVQIVSATYGGNCSNAASLQNNAFTDVQRKCNGETTCSYTPAFSYDPSPNCPKNFEVVWKCGAESTTQRIKVEGEAGGKPVQLNCGPKIQIESATYGQNCGVPVGSHTSPIRAACDALSTCSYPILGLGDPKVNCAKAYDVRYRCGSSPVVYTARLDGEAGGKTITFACDAAPTIQILSTVYGANCGVTGGTIPKTHIAAACDGRTSCDYPIVTSKIGDPKFGCAKSWSTLYKCGTAGLEYAVSAPAEADGKTVKLSCVGASGYTPAPNAEYLTGRRACVSKTCAWNEKRDADMNCVLDAAKQDIQSATIKSAGLLERYGTETSSLQASSAFTTKANVLLDAPQGIRPRLTPWITREFYKADGTMARGFVCALPPVELNKTTNGLETVTTTGQLGQVPLDCNDSRANPFADAAKRLKMTEANFRAQFTYPAGHQLHMSIDAENAYGFGKRTAPNPPGFFYDPARNYVDLIAFYQQRELHDIATRLSGAYIPAPQQKMDKFQAYALGPARGVHAGLIDVRINGGAQSLNFFDTVNPTTSFDVSYFLEGDWPANPFAPSSGSPTSFRARNLRATVEVYPYNDEAGAIRLGSIPISDPNPVGGTKSATFTWPNSMRDAIFSRWGGINSADVKICIDIDGYNTRNGGIGYGDANWQWSVEGVCRRFVNGIVFARDYTKRPFARDASTANVGNSKSATSGDRRTSGTQDDGQEKNCTETGQGATMQQTCTAARRSEMRGSGDLGRTYYSSNTDTERVETTSAVTAAPATQAEALGYQVVDVDDEDQQMTFGKGSAAWQSKAPVKISIEPNWDLLIASLKAQPPPRPEWTKGRYGGRMGIGVGLGAKVPFGGFGLLTITASVGISIALDFTLKFQPENPYACINGTGTKCYGAINEQLTQAAGRKACQARGGRLAEMVTAGDRAGIFAVAQSGQPHWTGGQLGYDYGANPTCQRNQTSLDCKNKSTTKYGWIGSGRDFASSSGLSTTVTLTGNHSIAAADNGLTTNIPTESGVTFHGVTKKMVTEAITNPHPPVCEYEAAAYTGYSDFSLALNFGAGAGVGMSFCVPTDDPGLCVNGQLNFVDVSLTPTIGHSAFTLYNSANRRIGTRGSTYVDVPWQLSLLTGAVTVTVNMVFFSVSWTLAEYEGFRVAGGSLYRSDSISREDF